MNNLKSLSLGFILFSTSCAYVNQSLTAHQFSAISNELELTGGSESNTTIHAWLFNDVSKSSRTAVLYLSGASGAFSNLENLGEMFNEQGISLLVLDYYRGGELLPKDTDELYFPTEAKRALWRSQAELGASYLSEGLGMNCIGIMGASRGASIGFELAYLLSQSKPELKLAANFLYGVPYNYEQFDGQALQTTNVFDRTDLLLAQLPNTLFQIGKDDGALSLGDFKNYVTWSEQLSSSHIQSITYPRGQHGFTADSNSLTVEHESKFDAELTEQVWQHAVDFFSIGINGPLSSEFENHGILLEGTGLLTNQVCR